MNCRHCKTEFTTPQGHGGHENVCKRKRQWQRDFYVANGAWPRTTRSRAIGVYKQKSRQAVQNRCQGQMNHDGYTRF